MPDKFIAAIKQLITRSLDDPELTRYTGIRIRVRDGNEEATIIYRAYGEEEEEDRDEEENWW